VADLTDEYLKKMEDVLEVYERPYNPSEPVVCLDEKPVSLHDDVRPARPMAPGKIRRPDNEYQRCGTANVFCAVEPKAGKHFTLPTPDRSAPQLAQAMETIITSYPAADTIHLIMDNLNIHRAKTLTDYFGKDQGEQLWSRLTVHYTPKHTGVGSTRPRLRLVSSPANVSPGEESQRWRCCSGNQQHGTAKQTGTAPKSTGSSRARRPD